MEGTKPVPMLHFEEAAELAYFGAKISASYLHSSLWQKLHNIPVRLLNTLDPSAWGTIISNKRKRGIIEAVAAKDSITAIKIKSGHMLLAYGFLRKVFEIFESNQTPIDMITTSEVGVSVTIDNTSETRRDIKRPEKFGTVTVDKDMVIICIVGDMEYELAGFQAKVINALKDIPFTNGFLRRKQFQHFGSWSKAEDKKKALNLLSEALFN